MVCDPGLMEPYGKIRRSSGIADPCYIGFAGYFNGMAKASPQLERVTGGAFIIDGLD